MNFQGLQAKYRRLFQESAAWKLLRADNSPLILAFLGELFSEDSEVPFSRARVSLDAELVRCRELGLWETETGAGTYLNKWIREGWLREMDDTLTKTDASEIALRFSQGLDERSSGTTASHLRIVQEAVRDFAVAISPNVDERVTLLEDRKSEIQREIDALKAGIVTELTEVEQRERIREIYQLASVLTGDFRRVEDEIRRLDQEIRIQIIEGDSTRGDVLLAVLEKEALLAKTDAGSAFESFFDLLCDQNRTMELRDQLRSILNRPVAEHLSTPQRQFLSQLMRELSRESDRVFQIRRRTEESLRAYIESGTAQENRAVDRLLGQLERLAVELKNADCNLQTTTALSLPVGAASISSPESMLLKSPDEKLDTSGVEEQFNSREPSIQMLDCLDTVQIRLIAERALETLKEFGPMTIASIAHYHPLNSGLEELVAYLRVAKSVGAALLEEKESIEMSDKQGVRLRASIPTFLLSADLFPDSLDELVL
ncbi:DUF3375 domain-containing protein [Photorhabdus khanii]|uniref:DUF3375 domain-containing protein n=1 Tax=Photorhabdus khanii subsp. guanajuatensis TaxID=2100166 RepID=A0A4R4K1B5_9GAMM|nr:DUF3375 domain-containing protein [Photorhabdus khanii]TDB60282.1 DUF3375 domain-containing protein [Photorhabdus khanii subsp. guanajuatensis]